jgi:hypothetical protein
MGLSHVFLLFNSISPLLGKPQISNCDLCMNTTQAASVVTRTLRFSYLLVMFGHCYRVMNPQPYHLFNVLLW